mgnify:CR=1 FL=1
MKDKTAIPKSVERALTEIAQRHLQIETLEPRHADDLDFHDVAVWNFRAALVAAYEAGRRTRGGRR